MEEDYEKKFCECCGKERKTDYGTYEYNGKIYYGLLCLECVYNEDE